MSVNLVPIGDRRAHEVAFIAADDSVWVGVSLEWWDIASWIWWWLAPGDRKAWIIAKDSAGRSIRVRGVRMSRRYVHIRGVPGG